MIFKYNRCDISEKNLYYLSLVSFLNFGIVVVLIFLIFGIMIVMQEETFDFMSIFYVFILVMYGSGILVIEAIYRKRKLKNRVKSINSALNIDFYSDFSGKKLNKNLVYKDDEWFIAVPPLEYIILNRNYIEKDIVTENVRKGVRVSVKTVDGKVIEYKIDDRWKYVVDQMKKWIKK